MWGGFGGFGQGWRGQNRGGAGFRGNHRGGQMFPNRGGHRPQMWNNRGGMMGGPNMGYGNMMNQQPRPPMNQRPMGMNAPGMNYAGAVKVKYTS